MIFAGQKIIWQKCHHVSEQGVNISVQIASMVTSTSSKCREIE